MPLPFHMHFILQGLSCYELDMSTEQLLCVKVWGERGWCCKIVHETVTTVSNWPKSFFTVITHCFETACYILVYTTSFWWNFLTFTCDCTYISSAQTNDLCTRLIFGLQRSSFPGWRIAICHAYACIWDVADGTHASMRCVAVNCEVPKALYFVCTWAEKNVVHVRWLFMSSSLVPRLSRNANMYRVESLVSFEISNVSMT